MTINDQELATNLVALAFMCANSGTDNCDLILTTSMGKINCHINFSKVEDDNAEGEETGSDGKH
jgi:hypothetical protein